MNLAITPTNEKQIPTDAAVSAFNVLDWSVSDGVYYNYQVAGTTTSACGISTGVAVYTFRANGDLDNNTVLSTYEIAAGVMANGLSHLGVWTDPTTELE